MLTWISALILLIIFISLGAIHFYWALGGKWAFEESLPVNEAGELMLHPKKMHCILVGLGLFFFGYVYFLKIGLFNIATPKWIYTYLSFIIPTIFILRAIGDFKYVGWFKKVKDTRFGRMDTKIYTPLCFLIGALGLYLVLNQ